MGKRTGISIDPEAGKALYRQIADGITSLIHRGVYPPGYRLPTTRELARELEVHRNTAVRAYEELTTEGLIHSVVGRGSFVVRKPEAQPPAAAPQQGGLPWNSLLSEAARAEPLNRLDRLVRYIGEGDYVNLARMQPAADLVPADLIRRCFDYVLRRIGAEALGYAPVQGLPKLRKLISQELWRANVPTSHEEIVVTTGSQQALNLIAMALVNPGDTILMEEHSYPGAIHAFTAAGARIVAVPFDEEGPKMSALHKHLTTGAKGLYLMSDCGNPTGTCITAHRRRELVKWSVASGVPLIDDDYSADLDDVEVPVPLRALNGEVIYLGTFSKKLSPALRVGFVASPAGLVKRLSVLKKSMDLGTSLLHQHVLAEFIERGYLRTHLKKIHGIYKARRQALDTGLKRHLPRDASFNCPDHGILCWLKLPPTMDSEDFFKEALKQGVLVSPGAFHSLHPMTSSGVRLTVCAEPEKRLREGARLLGKTFHALTKGMSRPEGLKSLPSMDGV